MEGKIEKGKTRLAEMILRGARDSLPEADDRRSAEERYQVAVQLCSESGQ